jgi:hypothetical protein
MKGEIKATAQVVTPSTMKSHRHPAIPCTPSRPEVIPAEMRLPKAPEKTAALII